MKIRSTACMVAVVVSDKVVAGKLICPISVLFAAVPGVDPLFRNTRQTVATLVPSGSQVIIPRLPPSTASAVITKAVVPVPSLAMLAAVKVAQAERATFVKIGAKFGIV